MNDIVKTVQALQYSNILLKGVTNTIKNETKEQKGGFLSVQVFNAVRYSRCQVIRKFIIRKRNSRAGSGNNKGTGIARTAYGEPLQNIMDF